MDNARFWLAAVVAPWPVPLIISILFPRGPWSFLAVALGLLTGYMGLFVLGLPLFQLLQRIGWLSLPTLTLSGGLAGVIVFYFFGKVLNVLLTSSAPFIWIQLTWGAALGISVALLFGLIAGIPLRIPREY